MAVAPRPSPESNAHLALPVGTVLEERFVIKRVLGRGGMGEVYEAEDLRLNGTRIALKTIRSDYAANRAVRERFQHEVLLARSVNHPNVCPVYEFFVAHTPAGEIWFLTMKLLTGETLSARLRREGKLPVAEALSIARQIAAALDAAHSAGVVHRDLKPGNIFLEQHVTGVKAVVTDFGLAKSWASAAKHESVALVGTPGYIAPELLTGEPATPQSDIYSLGVVLDQIIFGNSTAAVCPPSFATQPIPPDPDSRRALEVIRRCLEPRPERRFPSATAVVDALATHPQVRGLAITRRKSVAGVAAGTALAATMGWLERGSIDNLLHPIPRPRRVALLPASNSARSTEDGSLLTGLIDSVGYALARAEPAERDLFVVPPRYLRQQRVNEVSEAVGLFGVNLVLWASLVSLSQSVCVALDLVLPSTNSLIRQTSVGCPIADLHRLPIFVAQAAANLLAIPAAGVQWQTAAPKTNNSEAYAAYERARGLISLGGLPNVDKASQELKRSISLDPEFAEAWAVLGQAYSQRYSLTRDAAALELAERNVNKAFEITDGLPAAYSARASLELNRGQYAQAVRDLQSAARLDPENANLQLLLAKAYAASGKLDLADHTFQHLLDLRPNDWTPLNDWGSVYYRRANYARAEQLFHQATLAAPQAALPWRNLGAVYMVTNQMDKAQQALDRSIALLPSGEAYANRGTALLWLRRYREAAQACELATRLNPERYVIWGNQGDAYQMLGNAAKARTAWSKAATLSQVALSVNSTDADALSSLALYQAKLGDRESSLQSLNRLSATGSLTADQLLNAAIAYELLDEREMALRLLKQCFDRGQSRFEIDHAPELQTLRKDRRFQRLSVEHG